jgi:hypothetical protein
VVVGRVVVRVDRDAVPPAAAPGALVGPGDAAVPGASAEAAETPLAAVSVGFGGVDPAGRVVDG